MTSAGLPGSESPSSGLIPDTAAGARTRRAALPWRSLGEALNGTRNSLGVIRLVLASLVIVDHAFILGGFGFNPLHGVTRGQASLGSLAVAGFFAISGYLITKSGQSADGLQFLWRRALRIFPAFWVVLLVTAFLAGPTVWVLEGRALPDYFTASAGPFDYLASNWTLNIGMYGIGDLLTGTTPYGLVSGQSNFNGSLWTLRYEWTFYLLIAVLLVFAVLRSARILVAALAAFFFLLQFAAAGNPAVPGAIAPYLADPSMTTLGLAFLSGAALAVYSRQVPLDDRLGLLSGAVLLGTLHWGGFASLGIVAGAYFVLYLAVRLPPVLQRVGAHNDYSYGLYIYGFLVQQILAYLGVPDLGYVVYVLAALVISLGLAWLSWHGIEKRALAWKDLGPGRGWRFWVERASLKRHRGGAGRTG